MPTSEWNRRAYAWEQPATYEPQEPTYGAVEPYRSVGAAVDERVAALVERCKTISLGDVEKIAAVPDAAWDVAMNAAWAAARNAAWDAARNAAWDTAWNAAWDTAWNAAWAAAWAAAGLVVRDLIGQHGFTQDHYDTLTKVWRTTIGPIHPDDLDAKVTMIGKRLS